MELFWRIIRIVEVLMFLAFIFLEVIYDFNFICHTDVSGKMCQTMQLNILITDGILVLIDVLINKF